MELPLTARELHRLSRRRGLHSVRMIAPAGAAIFMLATALSPTGVRPETIGNLCYIAALIAQYAVVYLVVPLTLAETIAREKDERTLTILMLANPRPQDVILSKYIAPMLLALLLIAGTLPIMAFAGFFGAVPPLQANLQTLVSLLTAAAIGAITILVSVLSARPRQAVWSAYAIIAILILGAEAAHALLPAYHISPWHRVLIDEARDTPVRLVPLIAATLVITLGALAAAVRMLPRQIQSAHGRVAFTWRLGARRRRTAPHGDHALYQLLRASGWTSAAWDRPVVREFVWFGVAALSYLLGPVSWFALTTAIAYQVHATVNQLARTGALEDLRLATPDGRMLADALFRQQFRAQWYVVPAFVAGGIRQFHNASIPAFALIMLGLFAVGIAVTRYAVAYACAHWWNRTPGSVALATLWRVVTRLLASMLIGALLFIVSACFVAWFNLGGIIGSLSFLSQLWFVLFGSILWGDSREERLRFEHGLEKQLRYES